MREWRLQEEQSIAIHERGDMDAECGISVGLVGCWECDYLEEREKKSPSCEREGSGLDCPWERFAHCG